jgi:HK97 family phage prohead protease
MDRKTLDTRLEIKFANTSGEEKTFTGYGAFFNNIDSYGDVIASGAFTKTLADFNGSAQMPAMLWNHDAMAMPIGVWLDIAEDAHGLKVSGQFLDTTSGNDSYILAKTGAVSGLSIGYIVTGFEMSVVNGKSIRTITEVQLFEISLVTFPANDLARVQSVKNQENEVNIEEIKAMLDERDAKLKVVIEEMMVKSAPADTEVKSIDDDEDCDCDPDEDDDCECDDEDKSEAKYHTAFIEAVNNLTAKLAKENHGQ